MTAKLNSGQFYKLLDGGDLRGLASVNKVISLVESEEQFSELFNLLFHNNRLVVMRAADVIEKITVNHPQYLAKHKRQLMALGAVAQNKELCWHIAQLLPRLPLTTREAANVWVLLSGWAKQPGYSRIVRVNALQALFDLAKQGRGTLPEFERIASDIEKEKIPSLNARIKKLRQLC